MRGRRHIPSAIAVREFPYSPDERTLWQAAHGRWWPQRENPSVWGRFAQQAASGRYTFSGVNQPERHFAETLVAWHLEQDGYVCWTGARILRKPGRGLGRRAPQTDVVDSLLKQFTGTVPQQEYEKRYFSAEAVRLKTLDVVGFHFGRRHLVFSEVKRHDSVHPEQAAALTFLQELYPEPSATVFVAWVRERGARPTGRITG